MKEEQTATRAANLEQENVQLRNEVASLKSELTKLRILVLANPTGNNANGINDVNGGIVKPRPLSLLHDEPSSSSD